MWYAGMVSFSWQCSSPSDADIRLGLSVTVPHCLRFSGRQPFETEFVPQRGPSLRADSLSALVTRHTAECDFRRLPCQKEKNRSGQKNQPETDLR